jgi:hypothetical protein
MGVLRSSGPNGSPMFHAVMVPSTGTGGASRTGSPGSTRRTGRRS